jgi:two-component sensor histidine kinase
MLGLDLLARFEIRNRARDPQDPVVGASREPQPRDCVLHQLLTFPIQFAKTTERARRHLGIAENAEGLETARLALPSGENALPDGRRFFAFLVLGQFFVFHGGNLDVQIDPVEQRTGDSRKITLDQGRRAIAFVQRVAGITARAGIHGRREHEALKEGQRHGGPADGDLAVFERLRDSHGMRTARQNVVSILDEVAQNFQDRPPSVRVASTAPEILGEIDADRMRTVIRNLLENAIKYSLPDSRAVEVSAAQNGEYVVIRVTDDGPGIPERDIPSLFEPFFRVDRSRSKKTGGYGLGLSISKRIVEVHGGTIAVHNNRERGTSFVITLPKPCGSPKSRPP